MFMVCYVVAVGCASKSTVSSDAFRDDWMRNVLQDIDVPERLHYQLLLQTSKSEVERLFFHSFKLKLVGNKSPHYISEPFKLLLIFLCPSTLHQVCCFKIFYFRPIVIN